ncbi:hypothetical protein OHT59_33800 [Streptomyces sp. NBC_00243]|uniref:hypothetical protein n=1 Tax=Streptomyces sp. NBC_00243 TaxID=2975688 RepID=UPI002DD8406F|nr:hypothetical protein [Streptomyces sp. NBC_00243]WRZ23109.1 hypothetical protein OHT59_33800 [Streptomyces sp. NBC_00243]
MSGSLRTPPPGAHGDTLPHVPLQRRTPSWAQPDPVDELAMRIRDFIAAAVHPDEIAALLESDGMSDDQIRERYGMKNSFALAEELYERVERHYPEPEDPPHDPWQLSLLGCLLRGVVFALPGLGYVLGAPLLAGPKGEFGLPAGTVPLLAGALCGWTWNQGLAHRAYSLLGLGDRSAARRSLLVGAPVGILLGSLVALAAVGTAAPAAVAFAAGQSCYLGAATVLLVMGRERALLAALLPMTGGAILAMLHPVPDQTRLLLLSGSLAAVTLLALLEVTPSVRESGKVSWSAGLAALLPFGTLGGVTWRRPATTRTTATRGERGRADAPSGDRGRPNRGHDDRPAARDAPRKARVVPGARGARLRSLAKAARSRGTAANRGDRWAAPVAPRKARVVPGARGARLRAFAEAARPRGTAGIRGDRPAARDTPRKARVVPGARGARLRALAEAARPRRTAVPWLAASLPYALFGLGSGVLVLYVALGDVLAGDAHTAVAAPAAVALTLSMGPAEWLLFRFRSGGLAGLRSSGTSRDFWRTTSGTLVRCLTGYLAALFAISLATSALWPHAPAAAGGVRLAGLLLLGVVLWTGLLLQSFGAVLSTASVCCVASLAQTAALAAHAGSPHWVGLIVNGAAAGAQTGLVCGLLGRATAHR